MGSYDIKGGLKTLPYNGPYKNRPGEFLRGGSSF